MADGANPAAAQPISAAASPRAVLSTYRLQLRPDSLTLSDAAQLVDYLHRLGVSHIYLSPVFTAMPGSSHGYDVTDPSSVSAALGGEQGLADLATAAHERGMGLIADIVPNHVGVADARENPWWWDVLKHGQQSQYAKYFDIDWSPDNGVGGRIALPVLQGDTDPAALTIIHDGPEPLLALRNMRFPIAPGTLDSVSANPLRIHDRQAYRLVSAASGLCTYRRFLDVSGLAAIRPEDAGVFADSHRLLANWCAAGLIDGVRVDHLDGLADPRTYVFRLRALLGPQRRLWAEKALGTGEAMERLLPADGTTGYDALANYAGVLVDPDGMAPLTELSEAFCGNPGDVTWLRETEQTLKLQVAQTSFAPDVRRLVREVVRDAAVGSPDLPALSTTTVELLTRLRVGRTDYGGLSEHLTSAVSAVAVHNPALQPQLDILVRALAAGGAAYTRFQQVSTAISAKAVEDQLFYRAARLVSLQEIGGDPGQFGRSLHEFHLANLERMRFWPTAMTTLSTHDTKRGEDVRARISVLSQVAPQWAQAVTRWRTTVSTPDSGTCLFLLQNMFGVWPADGTPAGAVPGLRERLHAYARKAAREAAARTSWAQPDQVFEAALHAWVDSVIDGEVGRELSGLVQRLSPHFWSDSLAQKLLQLCGPGIPDIYQGTELWDDNLVDPDNRRPVDFAARASNIRTLTSAPAIDATGAAKMWVTAHALWTRREHPGSFAGGTYLPLFAEGSQRDRVIAFGRGLAGEHPNVVAVAARHTVGLPRSGWGATTLDLPPGTWTNRLTSQQCPQHSQLSELFAELPVALLIRSAD